ncbi:MAG: FAD:protein FMN transferase [Psychromonas sp.]|nr:FAD:protein FMN transferase [Alteromonadales bacterium]MCP5080042.1 FAD:protein FMN transferase [Psychromonas sp.]
MSSECELLIESQSLQIVEQVMATVYGEAKRIEAKFSRYLDNNIVYHINHSVGQPIKVDSETTLLIDFAFSCYQLSEGLFDISSGVLRKAWRFDGSDNIPSQEQLSLLLPYIGLEKLQWNNRYLTLPEGMQLDFGGIGKEYAVDSCLKMALQITAEMSIELPMLLNFGGDLVCNRARENGEPWKIGIESVGGGPPAIVTLKSGALATSGDANRYLLKNGVRYSHILNPITGCSVIGAPNSVTVSAQSCIEAGLLSTMAMLQGDQAISFLDQQQVKFWVQDAFINY